MTEVPFYEAARHDVLFTQTANVVHANSTVETNLVGAGVGSVTLPANFLRVGRTIRISARAIVSTIGAGPGTITVVLKLGGAAGTAILTKAAFTPGTGLTNGNVIMQADVTCRTVGAGGTVFSQGTFLFVGNDLLWVSSAAVTIDTTAAQEIALTWDWSVADAGNTVTLTNLTIEALN